VANPQGQGAAARQIRALFDSGTLVGMGDGELLERFATRPGEVAELAFAALVERHGPMVLRVCRASLRDPHDSEDAFQATFLVLARRAGSLRVVDSLGPWLHGVACRVSAGTRAAENRRRAHERRAADERAASRAGPPPPVDDLGPALHEEIERLPARFRAPLVLCYLEGLTHEQAADRLACPLGTIRSRVARGRERLRRALARRGLAPSATPDAIPSPAVPPTLALAAVRLASHRAAVGLFERWSIPLLEGVLKPMALHPIKSAALILLASGTLALGLGVTAGQEPRPPGDAPRTAPDEGRFAAMERRLRDLEQKLNALGGPRSATRPAGLDPRAVLRKIRPRFDDTLIEKVLVSPGQAVKEGDPLVAVRSFQLAAARNECRARFVQWDHDHKYLVTREPLAKEGRITQIIWTDTQNDEKKSRLDYLISRDKLAIYGMTGGQIDKLLEGLGDDTKAMEAVNILTQDISRMTIVSPVDGQVVEVPAEPDDFFNTKDVLLIIATPKP